jgi:hypothetical protein
VQDYRLWVHLVAATLRGGFIAVGVAKVGLDVQFIRYRADDSVIGSFRSLWIVREDGGRWAERCGRALRVNTARLVDCRRLAHRDRTSSGGCRKTIRRPLIDREGLADLGDCLFRRGCVDHNDVGRVQQQGRTLASL